jgi:hypothetical protein
LALLHFLLLLLMSLLQFLRLLLMPLFQLLGSRVISFLLCCPLMLLILSLLQALPLLILLLVPLVLCPFELPADWRWSSHALRCFQIG